MQFIAFGKKIPKFLDTVSRGVVVMAMAVVMVVLKMILGDWQVFWFPSPPTGVQQVWGANHLPGLEVYGAAPGEDGGHWAAHGGAGKLPSVDLPGKEAGWSQARGGRRGQSLWAAHLCPYARRGSIWELSNDFIVFVFNLELKPTAYQPNLCLIYSIEFLDSINLSRGLSEFTMSKYCTHWYSW